MPSTWPLTMWPPSSSPILSERSRLTLSPTFQPPSVVTASVSAPTSVAIAVRLPRRAASTTVRHTPAWATDAPTSTVATS